MFKQRHGIQCLECRKFSKGVKIMADKEERILCNSYDGIQAQLMANNNIGMTRQEAIEVMAKAIFEDMLKGHNLTWEDADISAKKPFINQAESALNALLKGASK